MSRAVLGLVLVLGLALAGTPSAVTVHSDNPGAAEPVTKTRITDAGNVTWVATINHPLGMSRAAAAVVGTKLHIVAGEVSGGTRASDEIFDFTTRAWSTGPAHPGGGISNGDGVALSDTLIVVGGGYDVNAAYYNNLCKLNLSANTYTVGTAMPIANLMYYSMIASGGNAYVFGGVTDAAVVRAEAYRYNTATNDWTSLASMPLALRSMAGVAIGDTIYLLGGHTVAATPYNGTTNFLKYSISGNTWTTGAAMPFSATWGRAVAFDDPAEGWVIYYFGGYNGSATITNICWAYTLGTGTWTQCNSMVTARRSHACGLYADTLLAVCGYGVSGFVTSVEQGDIDAGVPSNPDILWLYADFQQPDTTLGVRLEALGDTLDYMDVQAYTPALGELTPYDAVGVNSNYGFGDRDALGNVLADYVDAGGGVVLTNFCFTTDGHGMGGRIMTDNYATLTLGDNTFLQQGLGWFNAAHPVMTGVTAVQDYFRTTPAWQPTAESVATWADGRPYVAVSQNNKVVGLNQYPGIYSNGNRTGDWALVIHNALWYVAGMMSSITEQTPTPAHGPAFVVGPNPARSLVHLSYAVEGSGPASLAVYDANGRLVRTLGAGTPAAGARHATWDLADAGGRRVARGVYFCKLATVGATASRKIVVQ